MLRNVLIVTLGVSICLDLHTVKKLVSTVKKILTLSKSWSQFSLDINVQTQKSRLKSRFIKIYQKSRLFLNWDEQSGSKGGNNRCLKWMNKIENMSRNLNKCIEISRNVKKSWKVWTILKSLNLSQFKYLRSLILIQKSRPRQKKLSWENQDRFQKLILTDQEILILIGLDCRDPQA